MRGRPRKIPSIAIKKIREMRMQGMSYRAIADAFGVTAPTIRNALLRED